MKHSILMFTLVATSAVMAKDADYPKPIKPTAEEIARMEARTQHFHDSKWGVFNHFIGRNMSEQAWNAKVDAIDVNKIADQLAACGAKFYFITMMQGGRHLCAPNATFDRIAGTKPGVACSRRDLPAELADALGKRGIDLYLYYTGDGPYADLEIAPKFGFGKDGRHYGKVSRDFVEKWTSVLAEYSQRYGTRVKGWWVDGTYARLGYDDDALLGLYSKAIQSGNPASLTALNNGVRPYYVRRSVHEDFTAGEYNDFYVIPRTRMIDGAQAFILVPLGLPPPGTPEHLREWSTWCKKGCKRDAAYVADYVNLVNRNGGVVAIDVYLGPDGSFDPEQMDVLKAVGRRTGTLRK